MINTREHWLSKRFEDRQRFPYGFSRSGDFTISQSETLEQHGHLFNALMEGKVSNPNDNDRAFIDGLAEGTNTDNEHAQLWLKYKGINRHLISASSSCKEGLDLDEESLDAENDDLMDWDDDQVA